MGHQNFLATNCASIWMNNIIETSKDLISIPSVGGIDKPDAILEYLYDKCKLHKIQVEILEYYNKKVGLYIQIINNPDAPVYALTAVIDTAPVGDLFQWNTDPFVPTIKDKWLFGRGSADSKAGAAIILYLIEYIKNSNKNFIIYFDADEHTGKFHGSRALIKRYPNIKGIFCLYPGNDKLIIGSRGFYRTIANIYGKAEHAGSRNNSPDNAILNTCKFVKSLELNLMANKYPLPPKISVTAIHGGKYFSIIPDLVKINIDIRTTFDFDNDDAEKWLIKKAAKFDKKVTFEEFQRFPPYMLGSNSVIKNTFQKALIENGFNIPSTVSGPSNPGNLFAMYNIDMTSGFGVAYKNAHAANECIDLSSIDNVVKVYKKLIDYI